MPFRCSTYNVLATAYLSRGDYSRVPPAVLDPARRIPSVVRRVASLDADLLCLQEVEGELFSALQRGLNPLGYVGRYERKGRHKPDGCATFWREAAFTYEADLRLDYEDHEQGPDAHSGHLALLLVLNHAGRRLGVANTHLRWDKTGTRPEAQVGYRQAADLLEACRVWQTPCDGWLICGDLNRRPDGEVIALIREAGYEFPHRRRPQARSAVANGRAGLIDYLFHTAGLRGTPIDPPAVSDTTVLPSEEQPSDHLPLSADFEWVG